MNLLDDADCHPRFKLSPSRNPHHHFNTLNRSIHEMQKYNPRFPAA